MFFSFSIQTFNYSASFVTRRVALYSRSFHCSTTKLLRARQQFAEAYIFLDMFLHVLFLPFFFTPAKVFLFCPQDMFPNFKTACIFVGMLGRNFFQYLVRVIEQLQNYLPLLWKFYIFIFCYINIVVRSGRVFCSLPVVCADR